MSPIVTRSVSQLKSLFLTLSLKNRQLSYSHQILLSTLVLIVSYPLLFTITTIPVPVKLVLLVLLTSFVNRACNLPTCEWKLNQVRTSYLVLGAVWPLVMWICCFSLILKPQFIRSHNHLSVDTTTLPALDSWLVHQPAYLYFMPTSDSDAYVAADLVAWFVYGVLHFISPLICVVVLALSACFYNKYNRIDLELAFNYRSVWHAHLSTKFRPLHRFLVAFGSMNLCGVLIQFVFPTSPPWYNLKHGAEMPAFPYYGDPAGLARIDRFFGIQWYAQLFHSSPIVFGAFPSLHAGFATLIVFSIWTQLPKYLTLCSIHIPKLPSFDWIVNKRIQHGRILCVSVPTWVFATAHMMVVWWSTMYLCHHFLTDLICGSALALYMHYIIS